jgi:hypothetical protein
MNVLKNGPTRQPLAHAESANVGFAAAHRGAHHKLFEPPHAYATTLVLTAYPQSSGLEHHFDD